MTPDEISSARNWAEINAGEDNPLDWFEWKLLDLLRAETERIAVKYERRVTSCEEKMGPLESIFEVSGPTSEEDESQEVMF